MTDRLPSIKSLEGPVWIRLSDGLRSETLNVDVSARRKAFILREASFVLDRAGFIKFILQGCKVIGISLNEMQDTLKEAIKNGKTTV